MFINVIFKPVQLPDRELRKRPSSGPTSWALTARCSSSRCAPISWGTRSCKSRERRKDESEVGGEEGPIVGEEGGEEGTGEPWKKFKESYFNETKSLLFKIYVN